LPPVPPRPPRWQERLGAWLLVALAPRLTPPRLLAPPAELEPCEAVAIPRSGRPGALGGRWYPARAAARGAVLLLHPWVGGGQAYFFRGERLGALREAGYHALTVDLPGFGSSPPMAGLPDRDLEEVVAALRARAGELPLHTWGVSAGGHWMHLLLSRRNGLGGAVFEHVSPHPLEFSSRVAPGWWPVYRFFRLFIPQAYRYLDLRRHAPWLTTRRVAYIGGGRDLSVPAEDTRELARLAGGECLVIPEAGHLGAIRIAPAAVIATALATFAGG
jgi:pimeloyl-ACP methyl ester carboxylesterase